MMIKVGDMEFNITKKIKGRFQKTTPEDLEKLRQHMIGKQKLPEIEQMIELVKEDDLKMPKTKETKPDDILITNLNRLNRWIVKIGYPNFEGKEYTIEQLEKALENAEMSSDFIQSNKILKTFHNFWKWRNDQFRLIMNEIMLHLSKVK